MQKMRTKQSADQKFRTYALQAFNELEAKRTRAIQDLREAERGIKEMYPTVAALLGDDRAA